MGKKQVCFFQTAETGNRTPDSGVKGSGANHYPRAPALNSSALQISMILTQRRFNAEPPSPVLANIYSILASEPCCRVSLLCTSYTRCRPTHPIPVQFWASVAAHSRFNDGQSSTTLAQHYYNIGPAHYSSRQHCGIARR